MKYMKKTNIYRASNVSFDPKKIEARSYDWWIFVVKYKDLVIFNHFNYSATTNKHQSKVNSLLVELGIKPTLRLYFTDKSLIDVPAALEDEINQIKKEIVELESRINAPRTHKIKNIERRRKIENFQRKIKVLEAVLRL